jgi:uncharacterized protein YndB with AHSA1/START domain
MTTETVTATQVHQIYIRAAAQAIWDAITKPEFTALYFFGARITATADRVVSLSPNGDVWGDEAVLEYDPPRRLVQEWLSRYDPELADEEPSRVTWEIEPQDGGVCKLTVIHDRLEGAPKTAESVAGGWMFVLSGLKTVVETGSPLTSAEAE